MASDAQYGNLSFDEAIKLFRSKVNLPTRAWDDVLAAQHDRAFMIAGATKTALLEDFRAAVDKAVRGESTLADFRKDFDKIVAAHGWSYNGQRGWRSKVIFDTNVRQSYNCGREAQMSDPDLQQLRPYLEYMPSDSLRPRPLHKSWVGTILPANDPWWNTHKPMNGWGCKCKVFMLSERDLQARGKKPDQLKAPDNGTYQYTDKKTGEIITLPRGVDYGFQYSPCKSVLAANTPRELDRWPQGAATIPQTRSYAPMPVARSVAAARVLPDNLSDDAYISAFLGEFDAAPSKPAFHKDVNGEVLPINEMLFTSADGALKLQKRGRAPYVLLLADTIKSPDEVWALLVPIAGQPGKYALRKRYLARWSIAGKPVPGVTVFEYGSGGWSGVTAFPATDEQYLQRQRVGVLLYARPEKK